MGTLRREKHQNITLSLPKDLNALLHAKVPSRGISKYVADAVRAALEKDTQKAQLELEAAYEEASLDPDRQKVVDEWSTLDADTDIEGWEW